MEFIVKNWFIIVVLLVSIIVASLAIKKWLGKPTAEQIKNIKEWLLYAVCEAEKQLGGGTGQLKLRFVYDWAVERFKWLSLIKFETFKGWVDEALIEMKKMLDDNKSIKTIVLNEE